jgi:preprotein translocase subunit SecA
MRALWRALFGTTLPAAAATTASEVPEVNRLRAEYARLDDEGLRQAARRATTLPEVVGVTAVVASRVLGLQMFDVQIQGALGLAHGKVIEMPTGEGKTLAAVPAVVWHARGGAGVHVLTANDYLARRDAEWMGGIYAWLGLSVAFVQQGMTAHERRAAHRADVTYATANEVGFDYLRDGLALDPEEQVHRAFAAAVIDEADSILIDEARIPLVIAGGAAEADDLPVQADRVVRELVGDPGGTGRPIATGCFTVEPAGRNVLLTPIGIARVERAMGCPNLFDAANLLAHTAVQDALHAHVLLRRDVDYVVHENAVLSVDEFKGRVVHERRWPAGLQTAIECKERVRRKTQGRVLGSITIEHLVGLYPIVCGMTGTAAVQAEEFRDVYDLDVEVIPPNRSIIRIDRPDRMFATQAEKERAVAAEVRRIHATGQPVLIGTASVEASERLSRALDDVPHHVLNARHETEEAAIIARAGERGAVTVSTNMAGRGVDIQLGPGVAELGGLHVIGTNRHESRRIDHQLRGRAGRQGDPGSSEFFVSREDPLVAKYGGGDPEISPDQLQRIVEGQNLDIRLFLRKYEAVIEGQRMAMAERRQEALANLVDRGEGPAAFSSDAERIATLRTIDDLWSDYLAAVAELRSGTTWISLGYGDPLGQYLREVHAMFGEMQGSIEAEVADRLERQTADDLDPRQRGATWTYITTDQPFGPLSERVIRGLVKFVRRLKNG